MRISDWSSDVCSSDLLSSQLTTLPILGCFAIHAMLRLRHGDYWLAPSTACMARLASSREGTQRRLMARISDPSGPTPYAKGRSEERRGGKEGVRTCRVRWSPYH